MKKTKKKNKFRYILWIFLLVASGYLIAVVVPLPVINYIYLKYRLKEINKEYKQQIKQKKLNKKNSDFENEFKSLKKDIYDLYGNKVLIIPGENECLSLVSSGKDNEFKTNDDIKIGSEKISNKNIFLNQFKWNVIWHITDFNNNFYSAMYKYWQKNPLVTLTIPWGIPGLKDITITLSIGNYGKAELKSCEKYNNNTIPIMVTFNAEKFYNLKSTETIQCSLKMEYNYNNTIISTTSYYNIDIHPLNDFNWDNPKILACFLISDDVLISTFSEHFINMYREKISEYNFRKTGILYYALKNHYDNQISTESNQIIFPCDVLTNRDRTPYKISLLLSSLLKSQGIDINLGIVKENKEIFILVPVENIKTEEPVVTIDKSITLLGLIKVNLPKKNIKNVLAEQFKKLIMAENNKRLIIINPSPIIENDENSFLKSLSEGKVNYKKFMDTDKLYLIDIKSLRKEGYLPPQIKREINEKEINKILPAKNEFEKKYKKEIYNILKIEME
jgi:hypothetical protein